MLVDSHCHLNMSQFKDDLSSVIKNAKQHNVQYLQTICTKLADYETIKEITETFSNIFCSFGIHPNEADDHMNLSVDDIIKYTNYDKTIGIGETGLDYYYEYSNRNNQKQLFEKHIEASRKTKLPIIIHTRKADQDMDDILSSEMHNGEFPGLIHCFSSGKELAKQVIDLGLYISISGIVTFKKSIELQEIVRFVPIDRILLETDSPYLAPVPNRGKRNEPGFVKYIAESIAQIKNLSYDDVASITTKNFFDLFDKATK